MMPEFLCLISKGDGFCFDLGAFMLLQTKIKGILRIIIVMWNLLSSDEPIFSKHVVSLFIKELFNCFRD